MKTYEYRAVEVRQTPTGPWMVLFSAPANQIDAWAGVPQKCHRRGRDQCLYRSRHGRKRSRWKWGRTALCGRRRAPVQKLWDGQVRCGLCGRLAASKSQLIWEE